MNSTSDCGVAVGIASVAGCCVGKLGKNTVGELLLLAGLSGLALAAVGFTGIPAVGATMTVAAGT